MHIINMSTFKSNDWNQKSVTSTEETSEVQISLLNGNYIFAVFSKFVFLLQIYLSLISEIS